LDLCTCLINLSGESKTVVRIPPPRPKTYAEIILLRAVHGGTENVRDVKIVGHMPDDPVTEKARLRAIYGKMADEVYPGVSPNMPTEAHNDPYFIADPKPATPAKRKSKETKDTAEAPSPEEFPG